MDSTETIESTVPVSASPKEGVVVKRNLIIVALVLLVVLSYLSYSVYKNYSAKKRAEFIKNLKETAPKFNKKIPTETYTKVLPPLLPKELFTGKVNDLGQSYQLDYGKQKQSTVVFMTKVTARANYESYTQSFEKDGWTIANRLEKDTIFSLYAKKGTASVNMTTYQTTPNATSSQVSLTYLN